MKTKIAEKAFFSKKIVGQDHILQYLRSTLKQKRLASAYLFHGPNAVGKRSTAQRFLATILCLSPTPDAPCGHCESCIRWGKSAHPDAVIVDSKELTSLGIDEVRELQRKLSFRPTVSTHRVALLGNADLFTLEAANALLKTLEEPPLNTVIILCATMLSTLPLTLRSRCQQLNFRLVRQPLIYDLLREQTDSAELALNLSHLAFGRPGIALALLEHPQEFAQYRERVTTLIDLLGAPLSKRLQEGSRLIPHSRGADARQELLPLIDLWLWIVRDAVLIRERNEEHIVHRFLLDSLRDLSQRFSTRHFLHSMRLLDDAKHLLRQNVNPQLAFEHCLLSL